MAYTRKGVNHKEAVAKILIILSKKNLCPKLYECGFSRSEFKYRCLIISQRRIQMDLTKVEAVPKWPTLKKSQQAPMIHDIFKLLQPIYRPLFVNTPKTSWFEKNRNPVCAGQEVQQSCQITEDRFHIGANTEHWGPAQGFCTSMWLLWFFSSSHTVLTMWGGWRATPGVVTIPINDWGWAEPQYHFRQSCVEF